MSYLHPQLQSYIDRVRTQATSSSSLSSMAKWVTENTTDPKNPRKPFSFKDHEFQIGILNCEAEYAVVRKISQAGLSEIQVRMILGLLAKYSNRQGIFTLPTASFAKRFVKTRFDPVIEASPQLSQQIDAQNDNTELKQIGSSFLHIAGTFGQRSAISIPADFLSSDEVNFSDQDVLSTYSSRLGHKLEGDLKVRREFSTPTVPNFAISKSFNNSSQAHYAIRHDGCGQWVTPIWIEDVVLPGFDDELRNFTSEDLANPAYRIDEAYLSCPVCQQEITRENQRDPEKRQWVDKVPGLARDRAGFWVQPQDVPAIHTPASVLRRSSEYKNRGDWLNFVVGTDHNDAENSFVPEVVDSHLYSWVQPQDSGATGCVLGLDVGKVSHLFIGKPEGTKLFILHAERIRETTGSTLRDTVLERIKQYGVVRGCVDAAPDFSTARALIEATIPEQIWAVEYTRAKTGVLSNYTLDQVNQIVKADRTRSLNETAKKHNGGHVLYPRCPEIDEIKRHLGNLKKQRSSDSVGEMVETWVKTGPEHYTQALNYLELANDLAYGGDASATVVAPLGISGVRFKENARRTSL